MMQFANKCRLAGVPNLAVVVVVMIGTLALLIGVTSADQCHLRELDLCAATLTPTSKLPASDNDIDKHCALIDEALLCLDTFLNRCATPFHRELVDFVISGVASASKKFCAKGSELRAGYLKHAACLVKSQHEAATCLQDVRAGLERLEEVEFEDRVTTACCVFARHQTCATDVVQKQCGSEAFEYGEQLTKMAIGNTPDVVCQGFATNPACDSLLPPPGTKPQGNSKSMVSKLFDLYVSM